MTRSAKKSVPASEPKDIGFFALTNIAISTRSRWSDRCWRLDDLTPGATRDRSTIHWDFDLKLGGCFWDERWDLLRGELKVFVRSMLVDPRGGGAMKPGSLGRVSVAIRYLVNWMDENAYHSLGDLTASACKRFVEGLKRSSEEVVDDPFLDVDDEDDVSLDEECEVPLVDEGFSYAAAWNRCRLLTLIWSQRDALREAGVSGSPEAPFGERKAGTVAREVTKAVYSRIPPLPDEVASRIMASARRIIGTPADDVIALQSEYLGLRGFGQSSTNSAKRDAINALESFEFSTIPGEDAPWRGPICELVSARWAARGISESTIEVVQAFRNLVDDVRDAGVIVLQSETGMRINEICGLKSGLDRATGLPTCVEIRRSKTGLNELFFVKGRIAKTRRTPMAAEWLVGMRPVGSEQLPAPVRAIQVLNRLHAPWRNLSESNSIANALIVSLHNPKGFPRTSESLRLISSDALLDGQRRFVTNHCDFTDLPNVDRHGKDLTAYRETNGSCIKTHQWRKTFALYVFRTDHRMIPAIAQQFKHLSHAMTEEAYIGNDPTLLEALDAVRLQETAAFLFEKTRGERPSSGKLSGMIDRHLQEIAALVDGKSDVAAIEEIEKWCFDNDLRIFFSEYGNCLLGLAPAKAKCHEIAGTSRWANTSPRFEARSPAVCIGCPLFSVHPEHAGFWIARYIENQTAWVKAKRRNEAASFRVAERRAGQSAAVLKALNVSIPTIAEA